MGGYAVRHGLMYVVSRQVAGGGFSMDEARKRMKLIGRAWTLEKRGSFRFSEILDSISREGVEGHHLKLR